MAAGFFIGALVVGTSSASSGANFPSSGSISLTSSGASPSSGVSGSSSKSTQASASGASASTGEFAWGESGARILKIIKINSIINHKFKKKKTAILI